MKSKIKTGKRIRRFFPVFALAVSVCLACLCAAGITARAQEQAFNIDAELLSPVKSAYDIRITVENTGEDWEGTARLTVGGAYGSVTDCAYDTALSLPQGSIKQFVVSVPKESFTSINGEAKVTLLDRNLAQAAYKRFGSLLEDDINALTMGVLSDEYRALTYLDMGGMKLDFYSDAYPIKLMELNKDNLADSLDSLNFLVIDSYDTGVLDDYERLAVKRWTDDGGVLIIGTGACAEDTLSGFDYLGIECMDVYPPGEIPGGEAYFDRVPGTYVDWLRLNWAELAYSSTDYTTDSISLALISSQGDGAVGILPYALSEVNGPGASGYQTPSASQSYFVHQMLNTISSSSNERYRSSYSSTEDYSYVLHRLLSALGKSTVLNFGVLKFILVIYVILAGPVCYLILRFMKKRELYWVAVPAMAFLGILLVFFAGRGFKVANTRVYSVTLINLLDREDSITYMHCYDARHREWSLRLAEGYGYAGPQISYSIDDDEPYYYHISKDGSRLSFGIRPTVSFEDSYFCAGRAVDGQEPAESAEGNIDVDYRLSAVRNVTNNTNHDFAYFAVLENDLAKVYSSLPAGETSSLTDARMLFSASLNAYYYNYYDYMWEAEKNAKPEELDDIIALGIGLCIARLQIKADETVIVGVVKDWDKAVDDNCSEVSYGCLYMVQ